MAAEYKHSDIPRNHVVVRQSTTPTLAYVGKAIRWVVDRSLDDEPDIDVVILAKDAETAKRFLDDAGYVGPMDKFYDVAMMQRNALHVTPLKPPPEEEDW